MPFSKSKCKAEGGPGKMKQCNRLNESPKSLHSYNKAHGLTESHSQRFVLLPLDADAERFPAFRLPIVEAVTSPNLPVMLPPPDSGTYA